jgi:phage baseplate assembly protein W
LVKKEDAAVKQAVLNLLLTNKGERVYDSEYGSNIRTYLFEPLDFGTAGTIKDEIVRTLKNYEPRVSIDECVVEPNIASNGFDVRLDFQVLSRADVPPISIEFFLNRSQ